MKSRVASLGIAAVLTAGLVLAPGVAMAAPASTAAASTTTSSSSSLMTGGVASTYGMWFVPCDLGIFRWC